MGKTLVSRTVSDSSVNWVYEISIGTPGTRIFSVAGAKADGVYNYDGRRSGCNCHPVVLKIFNLSIAQQLPSEKRRGV